MRIYATLCRLGNFRIGVSKKFGGAGIVGLLFGGMIALCFYMVYWTFLAMLWLMYGVCYGCYLIVRLSARLISKLNADRNDAILDQKNVPRVLRSDVLFWISVVLFPPLAVFILLIRDDKSMCGRIICGLCILPFALSFISLFL